MDPLMLWRGLVPAASQAPMPHRHLMTGGALIEQIGIACAPMQHLLQERGRYLGEAVGVFEESSLIRHRARIRYR